MKIKSLSYITIESTDISEWEAYAKNVVGLMKNEDLSDENNLFLRMDESPFRFQVFKGSENKYSKGGFEVANKEDFEDAKKQLQDLNISFQEEGEDLAKVRCVKELISFNVVWPITEALNDLNWEAFGDAIWFPQSEVRFDESSAAQSGDITHLQSSSISLTLVGPASVSFWWKVSSEREYDHLSVFLDGQILQHRISGEVDWEKRTIDIPDGSHSVSYTHLTLPTKRIV